MTDKLQETVNRENALHGETLIEDQQTAGSAIGQTAGSADRQTELKSRIAAGQQRGESRGLSNQARNAAETATQFVKDHPLATLAGGLALGLLVGSMTRSGRRVGRKAGGLASGAAESVMAFGLGLLDDAGQAAKTGKDGVSDLSEKMALKGRQAKRDADYYTRSKTDAASTASRLLAQTLSRRFRDL